MTSPVAGWYLDPASDRNVRWWDGARWTEHVQPHPTPAAAATSTPDPVLVAAQAAPIEVAQPKATLTAQHFSDTTRGTTVTPATVATATVTPPPLVTATVATPSDAPNSTESATNSSNGASGIDVTHPAKQLLLAGTALLAGAAGLFLPWMTSSSGTAGVFDADLPWVLTGGDLSAGVSGIFGHGFLYVLLFGVALAALSGRLPKERIALLVSGGAIATVTALDYLQFSGSTGDLAGTGLDIAIGFGLYAMAISGAGVLAAGLLTEDT